MASNIGNINVIVNVDNIEVPFCPHGPALLFSKYDIQSGQEKRFFACSAFRDRKICPFFQWEDAKVSSETIAAREKDRKTKQPQFTHKQFRERFHEFKQLRRFERNLCITCGLLLLPHEIAKHDIEGHAIKRSVSDQILMKPTELFAPLDNKKTYAQYWFSDTTVEFVISTLKRLHYSHVICVGCPRIHEAILAEPQEDSSLKLSSLLLDLDHRYFQMYSPQEFCRYNMFNHYFFCGEESKEIFEKFITEDPEKRVAMVIDPPFGGMVEALASSISKIEKMWQKVSGFTSEKHLPAFWFFPYFMEKRIIESCPSFSMLDYKVEYDNHVLFSGKTGRKQGSAVRIFTNVAPAEIVLPSDKGYWYCKTCKRYSGKENLHCSICDACTTKDGRTYVHCEKCGRCVKPSRVHCDTCNICDTPDHQCGQVKSTGCHICGEMDHKRRDCPNKNSTPGAKVSQKGIKRKGTDKKRKGGKKKKRQTIR